MKELFERIARFMSDDAILKQWQDSDAIALISDCQSAITELQRESEATQKRFELVSENAAMWGCENSELKERVERADALLRVLSGCMPDKVYVMDEKWSSEEPDDGDFVLVDFAAYFREEEKPL